MRRRGWIALALLVAAAALAAGLAYAKEFGLFEDDGEPRS